MENNQRLIIYAHTFLHTACCLQTGDFPGKDSYCYPTFHGKNFAILQNGFIGGRGEAFWLAAQLKTNEIRTSIFHRMPVDKCSRDLTGSLRRLQRTSHNSGSLMRMQ
jgi:hypothetical protein